MKEEPEAKESGPAAGAPSASAGSPEAAPVVKRCRYLRTYDHYATVYRKGLRTVKRWVAIGKQAGDLCPLDEPERLPAWWAKHMQYSMPADVLAICLPKPPPQPPGPPGPPGAPGGASEAGGRTSVDVGGLAAIGLKENLERLSKIHRANLDLLEKAFAGASDSDLQLRQRNAEKSARMLSDAQRAFDEWQKTSGESVTLADVKRDLLRVHTSMAQSLVSIFVGLGISRDRAISSVDTWFKHLRESRFGGGTMPELVRPGPAAAA